MLVSNHFQQQDNDDIAVQFSKYIGFNPQIKIQRSIRTPIQVKTKDAKFLALGIKSSIFYMKQYSKSLKSSKKEENISLINNRPSTTRDKRYVQSSEPKTSKGSYYFYKKWKNSQCQKFKKSILYIQQLTKERKQKMKILSDLYIDKDYQINLSGRKQQNKKRVSLKFNNMTNKFQI